MTILHDIHAILKTMETRMSVLDDKLTELKADVTAESNQVAAANMLLAKLFNLLQAALNTPTDDTAKVAAVQAIIDKVVADTSSLGSAVTANTPPPPPIVQAPTISTPSGPTAGGSASA